MRVGRNPDSQRSTSRRRRSCGAFAATALVLASAASLAFAQSAKLDPRFGDHGRVLKHLPGRGFGTAHGALDSAGRVLVGVQLRGRPQVLRYLENGELDTSFAEGGMTTTQLGSFATVSTISIDSQGRIIVAGAAPEQEGFPRKISIARLRPDGSLDSSFANGGVVTSGHPYGSPYSVQAIAIDSDDRIVVLGDPTPQSYGGVESDPHSVGRFIARFNGDGSEDIAFRDNAPVLGGFSFFSDVTIDPAGKIVAVGYELPGDPEDESVDFNAVVVRLMSDGRTDPSFSGDGRTEPRARRFSRMAGGVATDRQGRILVSAAEEYTVARLREDGAIDPSFGDRGRAELARFAAGPGTYPAGIAIDGRDRPILAGTLEGNEATRPQKKFFAFARLRANGKVDPSFGRRLGRVGFGQSKCRLPCPPRKRRGLDGGGPLIDPAGRLVLVGTSKRGGRLYAALARVRLP